MAFIVTIREVTEVEYERREWVKVADSGNERDRGAVYAYGPPVVATKTEARDVYQQTVEDLDLEAVILAVNGILVTKDDGTT